MTNVEPVDDIQAGKQRVIEDAYIRVECPPDYLTWVFREKGNQDSVNKLRIDAAEEMLEKLSILKGVSARVVYEEFEQCTACRYRFEIDPETGLTACCGREIEGKDHA